MAIKKWGKGPYLEEATREGRRTGRFQFHAKSDSAQTGAILKVLTGDSKCSPSAPTKGVAELLSGEAAEATEADAVGGAAAVAAARVRTAAGGGGGGAGAAATATGVIVSEDEGAAAAVTTVNSADAAAAAAECAGGCAGACVVASSPPLVPLNSFSSLIGPATVVGVETATGGVEAPPPPPPWLSLPSAYSI